MFWKNKKYAIIAGCGKLGVEIANYLSEQGYQVLLLDIRADAFLKIATKENVNCLLGDASDVNILESCKISQADCFVAVTKDDNLNSMIIQIAAHIYKVKETYVRLNDANRYRLLEGDIHIISPNQLTLQEFQRLQKKATFPSFQ